MHDQGPKDSAPNPEVGSPTPEDESAAAIRSNVRNILLANPLFPKFYADVVISSNPNSKLAKVLQAIYPKILDKVKSNMATSTCTHIKVSGVRCGSPALRGEQFCYFHQRMHRGVRIPPQARLHPIANLEDEESIQSALMEVIKALMRNSIDLKRATLILRALHIAVKNASRVRFKLHGSDSVKEIPEFLEPSFESLNLAHAMRVGDAPIPRARTHAERVADGDYVPHPPEKRQSREEFLADYYGYPSVEAYRAAEKEKGTAALATYGGEAAVKNVGTDAACPEPTQRVPPGGEAAVSHPASQLPPHDFKTTSPKSEAPQKANDQQRPSGCPERSEGTGDAVQSAPRKPPMTVKKEELKRTPATAAPKARQNAAHGVSRG